MNNDKNHKNSKISKAKPAVQQRRTRGVQTGKFKDEARKIVRTLGLQWKPVGAKFASKAGAGDSSRKLRVCEALDIVKNEKTIVVLSKENCSCFGGKHFTGWKSFRWKL